MSRYDDLESEVDAMIGAIGELKQASRNGWPSWRQVAKKLCGTEEEADRYAAIAELPQYRPYFALERRNRVGHVSLTEEGINRLAALMPKPKPEPNSPQAVAEAIRHYAAGLNRTHRRVEEVTALTEVGGKILQAVLVELEDGHMPHGTPVEFRPTIGGAWTHGTVVGQEPDSPCLYVLFDTEVGEEMLPGVLALDRGYLLVELAERMEALREASCHANRLFGSRKRAKPCVSSENAMEATVGLAGLATPWTRILWGPPGAGKTFAIAQLACQWVRKTPDKRILLVAPTNLAVDVLLEETVAALENTGLSDIVRERRVLRYGYAQKETLLSRSELLGPSEALAHTEQIRDLGRKLAAAERVRACERDIAELRAKLLAAQSDLQKRVAEHAAQALIVATTAPLTYLPHSPLADLAWSLVAVDEAIMVQPFLCYYLASLAEDALLLAGDPRQLGPVVENEQRLSDDDRKWAADDVYQAAGVSATRGDQFQIDERHPLLVRITEQRRCVPKVWAQVEHLYPGVRCAPDRKVPQSRRRVEVLPRSAVVLMDTSGQPDAPCAPSKKSWNNEASARLAVELGTAILGDHPDLTVGIITPFRAQLGIINKLLRCERAASKRCSQIQAGTVHQFQGSAADVIIFDVVEDLSRTKLSCINREETGLRLANVAITRARYKLIVIANRIWHEKHTRQHENPLLWKLIVERPAKETVPVWQNDDSTDHAKWPYESPYEALIGEAAKDIPDLTALVPQYRVCREDGSLISRADFAIPDLKYAVYVDGARWHLTRRGWRRDRRLRNELVELGWTFSVFGAHEVGASCDDCIAEIQEQVRLLEAKAPNGGRRLARRDRPAA